MPVTSYPSKPAQSMGSLTHVSFLSSPTQVQHTTMPALTTLASDSTRQSPFLKQTCAMLRLQYLLYLRNSKLVLTTILFPLAMIAIAIGMSALIENKTTRDLPQPGTIVPSIPLHAPFDAHSHAPLLLVAGGTNDTAILKVQAAMEQSFSAMGHKTKWVRIRSAKQLGVLQLDWVRQRDPAGSGMPDLYRAPVGGFFVHQGSTPINVSLVVNSDPQDGRLLGRAPPQLLTILHAAVQTLLPAEAPNVERLLQAGQDPRTRPTRGPVGPSGSASTRLLEQVYARFKQLQASNVPPSPWMVGFNGSLATFRVQKADQVDLSATLVPPFVTYGLYFTISFLADQLVRERSDGQFQYLIVNTLSISAYFLSFYLVGSLFLLVPCAVTALALAIWIPWFQETTWIGLAFVFITFSASTVTSSGIMSFFFKTKQSAAVVVGFGAAIITFVPFFVIDLVVKAPLSQAAVLGVTVFLPSFGLYHILAISAESHRVGHPIASLSWDNVIVPISLIMLTQAVVGYCATIYVATATTASDSTGSAPIWLLFRGSGDNHVYKVGSQDEEARSLEHPNAAIPLDPYLLSEKRRIQEGRQGERQDVVAINGLCMDFQRRVLDGLYLTVYKNECLAFLGPNGAGKSTAISILTGLLRPTHGSAFICGKSVVPFDPSIKRALGVCPQYDKVYPDLTVREHLEVFATIKGLKDVESAVNDALKDMALEPVQHAFSKDLSGGNRRRLSIGIACLGRPPVVILDEPTTGVDVATRRTIWASITELKKHSSIILVTHAMDEADALCERIGIMINGSLVCLGTPQRLKSLYGAAYKIQLRFHTPDAVSVAVATLDRQFPRGSLKVLNQAGPNLEVQVDMATLAAAYTGSTDTMIAQQREPQRLPDGRTVLVESAAIDRSRVTARFLGEVFALISSKRDELGVADWSMGEVTLSEVFVRLAKYHRSHVEEEEQRNQVHLH